jgi:hypothetical protein
MKPIILLAIVASMLIIGFAIAKLGEKKISKKIRKGTLSLAIMSLGLVVFGLAYAYFASKFPKDIGFGDILKQGLSIVIIGLATALIGQFEVKTMAKGALGLVLMGIGLAVFAIGYYPFAKATEGIGLGEILLQGLIIGGIGMITIFLGKKISQVAQGMLAMALNGLGLYLFSLGYTPFAKAVAPFSIGDIGVQLALLTGIGLINILAGIAVAATGGLALTGPLLFAAIGGGLYLFSLGYTPYTNSMKGTTLQDVKIQSASLTSLGTIMVAAGLAVGLSMGTALLGPALYAAAGGALLILAPGLQAMKNVGFTVKDGKELAVTLGAVAMAFSGVDEDDGFFGAIGGLFSRAAQSGGMLVAAVGYTAAGIALQSLSKGLIMFKAVGFTTKDSTDLALALGSISAAFAQAGGESSNPGGLFGKVFGTAFTPNATKKGIDAVLKAGDALSGIAKGLLSFMDFVDKKIDFVVVGAAIANVIGFIQEAFASVADQGNVEAGGFFGSLLGIKKNKVAEGIESVEGAGKILIDIAEGLDGFQGLKDPAKTAGMISTVLSMVGDGFSSIADKKTTGSFLGITWDKNKVKKGIKAVHGAGKSLIDIAEGLSGFEGLKNPAKTAGKIGTVLSLVGDAFSSIAGKKTKGRFLMITWDKNKVRQGIRAVDGAGKALTDIAQGLEAFSKTTKPESVAASIALLLTTIGDSFVNLYASNPLISPQLADFSSFIVTLGAVAEAGLLDKAADGISKIADSINKIDIDKTVAFGELFKSSAKLSEDKDAYRALADAVEQLRDIMQTEKGPSLIDRGLNAVGLGGKKPAAGEAGATTPTSSKAADPMKRLNSTLGRLEAAITALPASIQTMKLTVKQTGG